MPSNYSPLDELRRRQMYPNYGKERRKSPTPWFLPQPRLPWDYRWDAPHNTPDYQKPTTSPEHARPGYDGGDEENAQVPATAPVNTQQATANQLPQGGLRGVQVGGYKTKTGRRPS